MKVSDFVGDYAIHKNYGKVFVDSAPPRSKAMVNITVKQRGKGWNEATNSYEKYFVGSHLLKDGQRSLRWRLTNKDEHGVTDLVHIKSLSKWERQKS